ncbi:MULTISPECIES: ATP-binding protein [unclassified Oceanobacillus]|uniref:ATP-binding protein n=1 Tax=unclassified Oceanobacillus TaxID=2630292 RepID=UPI001BEAFEAE|nr:MULTISPECIES: ATP-binding protein [unclassified Oceanobacillus]MBT2601125.1 ATP-binding protein [Oceanobacillus sp. ISL-74]MBT2652351.1 ATP-binding protein [Oceanobacillus sp. ISL-73]
MDKNFPIHLLEDTPIERIRYFNNYSVAHPFFIVAFNEILKRITNPSTKQIFLVYGPSGVGKSELVKRIYERILKINREMMISDQSIIPIARCEAIAPDNGKYDWKEHYIRALMALNEPLIEHKIDIDKKITNKEIQPNRALRRSLENALVYRKTQALLIDEAQHMTFNGSAKTATDQMNLIKSLVSKSNTPHVMFGTYEILDFRDSLGQLARRGLDIHFRRYDVRKKVEQEMFIKTLWNIQKQIPLLTEPNLVEHWKYFYQVSVGCIGILKDLVSTTLEYNLHETPDITTLTLKHFKEYALTTNQTYKLAKEAIEGEANVLNNKRKEDDVSMLLGMPGYADERDNEESNEHESEGISKKKSKPGVRLPKRDAVGDI